ncbi:MAG: hypothetical protein E7058_07930 [Lentisphaerae bacterium]|nr:hypothetical protein [Lentisphaerota bacterium]
MKINEKSIANYVHTGGFNRLAGRPSAPGSWQPAHRSRWWKSTITLLGMTFLAVGLFFVFF